MKGFRAEELRCFTKALFVGTCFDSFLLQEARFSTFCTISIDGASERAWYTDEELEEERVEEYVAWKKLRPLCFGLIRGKKIPRSFRLTLRLPPEEAEKLLPPGRDGGESGGSFFLNLRFEKSELHCVSLASFQSFPPDRAAEERWDAWLRDFFQKNRLAVTEL